VKSIGPCLAISLALLCAACAGEEPSAPGGTQTQAPRNDASPAGAAHGNANAPAGAPEDAAAEAPEGGPTAGIPGGFPKDVPIYPGASVQSGDETFGTLSVALTSRDAAGDVSKFYEQALKKNGWDVLAPTDMGGHTVITATQGKRQSSVTISPDKQTGGTTIRITYIPAP
jgi:hypothetical protein